MERTHEGHEAVSYKTYIFTWMALVLLAAATIAVAEFHMGAASIVVALLIASLKAALILYFFMHLRYEKWFFKLAFLLPILVFMFSIGFTFLDVLYR